MYKVTKAFIYRAKLYPVGRKLTEREYERMMRDKIAIKRGVPGMVAPHDPVTLLVPEKIKEPVVLEEEPKQPVEKPVKKPGRPKKVVDSTEKVEEKPKQSAKPKQPAKKTQDAAKPKQAAKKKPQTSAKPKQE